MTPEDPLDDLRTLQELLRRESNPPDRPAMTLRLDRDDEESAVLFLDEEEAQLVRRLEATLLTDLRFEHMEKTIEEDLRQFAREAFSEQTPDAVAAFVDRHERDVEERVCYVPVEHLKVTSVRELFGMTLLPIDHEQVPDPHALFSLEAPVGSVAAVPVVGTHLGRMADRAQAEAEQSLRVLRVALRGHRMVPNPQLRFRISDYYTFGEGLAGFEMRPDVGWELELDDELVALAEGEPVARLVARPTTDVEKRGQIALRWLADAAMEGDDMKRLLYLTFALEAVLGDTSEGLKAHALAFRRAVLSTLAGEGKAFRHPDRIVEFYVNARSTAVHGEDIPTVDSRSVNRFAWDIRRALNEFLAFADRAGLTKRKDVRRAIDQSQEANDLETWIRGHALSRDWEKYFDRRGGG
jgi:hypothetical protein